MSTMLLTRINSNVEIFSDKRNKHIVTFPYDNVYSLGVFFYLLSVVSVNRVLIIYFFQINLFSFLL